MNVQHIQSFLAVERFGSFRHAARERGLSQPAVSRQVLALEASLGTRLLVRMRSGCRLTREGERFVEYAETLVRLEARARSFLQPRQISVGASSNIGIYLLPGLVRAYEDAHPGVAVDLTIGTNERVARQLELGTVEVALVERFEEAPGLIATLWRREPLVVIIPPGHAWSGRESIPSEWLLGEGLLGGERGTGTGALLRDRIGPRSAALRIVRQLGSTEAVKEAVRNRLGISLVMAAAVQDEVAAGSIEAVPLEGVPLTKRLYSVTRKRPSRPAPLADFLAFIQPGQSSR